MKLDSKSKKIIMFIAVFIGLIIIFYALLALTSDNIFLYYIKATANISAIFLRILGIHAISANGIVSDGSFSLYIAFGCEGSEPIMIYTAATLAFPSKWREKVKGAIIGSIILYGLNLVRILLLFKIGKLYPQYFRTFHGEIFPVIFIFLAIMLWLIWINRLVKDQKTVK